MNFKQHGISAFQAMWLVLLVAGMGMPRALARPALARPALAQSGAPSSGDTAMEVASSEPTSTELSVATDDSGPRTLAKFTVRVSGGGRTGAPRNLPAGVVTLSDVDGPIGSAVADASGVATFNIDGLRPGIHRIFATYAGTSSEGSSTSPAVVVKANASQIPDYIFALNATALTVKAGTDGTIIATVTPTNGFSQLVSLSCSAKDAAGNGIPLPAGVSCLFTPVNLAPVAGVATLNSNLNLLTTGAAGKTALDPMDVGGPRPGQFALAILLPGIIAFAGLRMTRRRTFGGLRFLSLATLLLVSGIGLSSCAARYHYLHNPPAANFGTPVGTYNLIITASSSSNSSIIVHSQNITLKVN